MTDTIREVFGEGRNGEDFLREARGNRQLGMDEEARRRFRRLVMDYGRQNLVLLDFFIAEPFVTIEVTDEVNYSYSVPSNYPHRHTHTSTLITRILREQIKLFFQP